jgi:Protein of unknown function (DUF2827)
MVGKRLHIGITIGLYTPDESLWVNGIKQNALALARTLKASAMQHRVTLVNTTEVPITAALPWDLNRFDTQPFDAVKESVDVLIVLGGQIGPEPSAALRARGVKLVGYKCGSEAVISGEAIIHGSPVVIGPHYNQHFNEMWYVPQIATLNAAYYETLHRCAESKIVPFVWSPEPLEHACKTLPNQGVFTPKSSVGKRINVLEPNKDMLKTFMFPMLVAEQYYRQHPEHVQLVMLMNLFHRREHVEMNGILNALDLYRHRKMSLEGRHDTPYLLAHYTDIVISHQSGNPLNYSYLEAAWMGYPLVHNAFLCKSLGFYYQGHDMVQALAALAKAMTIGQVGGSYSVDASPESATEFRMRQRQAAQPFVAETPNNIQAYERLIQQLISTTA